MKLTNKQALILFGITKDSLRLSDNCGTVFSISIHQRKELVNQILSQQENELVDLNEKYNNKTPVIRLSDDTK